MMMRLAIAVLTLGFVVGCGASTPKRADEKLDNAMNHASHGSASHKHGGGHHKFDDAEHWSKIFDAADRDEWQKPDVVIAAMGLGPGDIVADIGAGTGYFTMKVAKELAKGNASGKVIAVDIEPNLIRFLGERATKENLTNVTAVLGGVDEPRLTDKATVALVVDTAHHIENRPGYFAKLREQMHPGGRVIIVEFHADRELPVGPPKEMRISHEALTKEMRAAGFQEVAVDVNALPYQYIATYRAP